MTNELKKVPELRFPEFNGEWEKKRLGEVVNYKNGGSFESLVKNHGVYKLITLKSVNTEGKLINSEKYIDDKCVETLRNDTLVMILSEQAPGLVGMTAIIPNNNEYVLNQRVAALVPNQFIDSQFLSKLINRNQKYFSVRSAGTKVKNISKGHVESFNFLSPDYTEQQKIGEFFSKLDRQIELEEQKLKKLEEQKKGYMQKIFSQELRFKDEKGNYYPEWESRYLNELCLINPKVDQVPNSFLYIDLESVNNGKIEKIKEVNKINAPSRAQRLAKKYDVFYQTVRPYQKNNFINLSNRNDIVVSTGYAQLRPSVQFYYLYSLLLTNSFMNKVLVKCTGTNYPAINSTDLSLIQILSSSVFEEQEKIGNFFSKLDELINKQNQKIDGLKKRKRGFLQKMFV
ncbi:restriction endonuclease subunit S [Mammaliicoccus sciuri]|uniref:restriction endonuclease subunit S n=1 Tax=Mammaliicoccus sciuri TaxID=1296 RepID=UPI002DBD18CD|nr:restriction endonuclease subunit S [Mammaliicoccus sciuri]MEB7413013.1 restriction endonuclease subunit S [Mammaliicoccus sciuri]